MGKCCEVGRCVFVFRVGNYFFPLSEFFRVFHVGFGVSTSLAEDFAVRVLRVSCLFFRLMEDVCSFFAISCTEYDLFVFVEFS